jgi:hypothetical protein
LRSHQKRIRTSLRPEVAGFLVAAALLLSGCGDEGPHMSRLDATSLITVVRRIPGEAACAQTRDIRLLQRRAVALVNARRVPPRLQESLMSGVNALTEVAPVCIAPVQAAAPSPAPRRSAPRRGAPKTHAKHHGHGKGE